MSRLSRRTVLKQALALSALTGLAASACAPVQGAPKASPAASQLTAASSSSPAGQPASVAASGASTSTSANPATVRYWHIYNETQGLPTVRELVGQFGQKAPSIAVEERTAPGSYGGLLTNLQVAFAAKDPPELAGMGFNHLEYVVQNLPHVPIEQVMQASPGSFDGLSPSVMKLGRYGDTLHGFPYALSVPLLYVNATLFEAAGLPVDRLPSTWEDVREAARTVKTKTGKFGAWIQTSPSTWYFQAMIEGNGGQLFTDGKATFDSPAAIEAMQLWADLARIDGSLPNLTNEEGTQSFLNGDIAMAVYSTASLSVLRSGAKFTLLTSKFPTFGSKPRRLPGGGNNLFIFATDPERVAAASAFFQFLTTPEGLTTWVKGTGYLPPREDIINDERYLKPWLDQNTLMKPVVASVSEVVPWISSPGKNGPQADQLIVDARSQMLTGQADAATAMREAARKVNALLGQA